MQKLIRRCAEKGSVIVGALVFGMVFGIAGAGALRLITSGSDMHRRDINIIKSYWANEAALRIALRYMSRVGTLPTSSISSMGLSPALAINGYTPAVKVIATLTPGGTYNYSCSSQVVVGEGVINTVVCSSFTANNISRYTWFTKQNQTASWEAMIVNGDYHCNGYVTLSSSMTNEVHVTGKMTTAGRVQPTQTWDRPNFPDEYRLGLKISNDANESKSRSWLEARLPNYAHTGVIATDQLEPTSSSFSSAYTVPVSSSVDSVAIRLNGANVNIWKRTNGTWALAETQAVASITGGILKIAKPTYVYGNLDGKLTIVTTDSKDIITGGHIRYANTDLSTSDDVLALVSDHNLVIPKSTNGASGMGMSHNFTTTGVNVDASLFMSHGGLDVKNMSDYSTLRDFTLRGGALLNDVNGTFSNGKGIRGVYNQDPRFVGNSCIAPGIPFTRATDEELSTSGTVVYMWLLGNGTWRNVLTRS